MNKLVMYSIRKIANSRAERPDVLLLFCTHKHSHTCIYIENRDKNEKRCDITSAALCIYNAKASTHSTCVIHCKAIFKSAPLCRSRFNFSTVLGRQQVRLCKNRKLKLIYHILSRRITNLYWLIWYFCCWRRFLFFRFILLLFFFSLYWM